MAHIDKKSYLPSGFLEEFSALRKNGVRSSHAYEILAKSYGYNTWIGMRTALLRKVGEPS